MSFSFRDVNSVASSTIQTKVLTAAQKQKEGKCVHPEPGGICSILALQAQTQTRTSLKFYLLFEVELIITASETCSENLKRQHLHKEFLENSVHAVINWSLHFYQLFLSWAEVFCCLCLLARMFFCVPFLKARLPASCLSSIIGQPEVLAEVEGLCGGERVDCCFNLFHPLNSISVILAICQIPFIFMIPSH